MIEGSLKDGEKNSLEKNRFIGQSFFFSHSKTPSFKNSIDHPVEKGQISSTVEGEKGEISCIFSSMTPF